jgi:hypothetical protein
MKYQRTLDVGTGDFPIRNKLHSLCHRETLEFNTQQLCLMAAREFDTLTAPVVSEGVARYKVLTTCVQTSEVVKK